LFLPPNNILLIFTVITVYPCGNEEKDLTRGKEIELVMLNFFTKDCGNFSLSKISPTTLFLFNTHSQYFHFIYDGLVKGPNLLP